MTWPVLFVSHGAPPLADDPVWTAELARWGHALGRPDAILMVSAHWEAAPIHLGATTTVPLVYDFYGFEPRFYQVTYPAPGAPALAERVRSLLGATGLPTASDPQRGLDHGAYVPLLFLYPQADVPVLQLSMPSLNPRELHAIGHALAPLRDEGVLLVGSGFMTHNLREGFTPSPAAWALEFDAWATDVLRRGDTASLLDADRACPATRRAHPRTEHLAPLFVAAGASRGDAPRFPVTGFWLGSFSKRSVQFG